MRTAPVWALLLVASAASVAQARKAGKTKHHAPPPVAAAIDNPCVDGTDASCKRHALDGFFAALAADEGGTATHPVRISYLGDSITADDTIAQRLRADLDKRFGDGGPGFVHVAPLPGGGHKGIRRLFHGWKVYGVANPMPADRLLGFGGGTAESSGGGTVKLQPKSKTATHADVYYLAQPGGGDIEVVIDGKTAATISTDGKQKKASFQAVDSDAPIRTLELRASGKVRLFGVTLEATRGLVVDNLGVKNATAKEWGKNRSDHWKAQIAHRAPDLFVVMIGSNEAGWLAGKSLAGYQKVIEHLLEPIRAAGSCLVVGPMDQVDFEDEKLPQRRSIVPMVEAQRAAATAAGCAFWDAYSWMGGARASLDWFKKGWMTNDFYHPTTGGDHRIADALAAGLLDGYAKK
jgi:hypothetical protein